jgi:hypothetical protein
MGVVRLRATQATAVFSFHLRAWLRSVSNLYAGWTILVAQHALADARLGRRGRGRTAVVFQWQPPFFPTNTLWPATAGP